MYDVIEFDTVVIGAGVIGLAVARQLSAAGNSVLVADCEKDIGSGNSSRNSGVIHAGIYYEPYSLKSKFCFEGRHMLYEFCAEFQIAHKKLGKLIVAINDDEVDSLHSIIIRGENNGVEDLTLVDNGRVGKLEPNICVKSALISPSSGIVDAIAFMKMLQMQSANNGVEFAFNTSVDEIEETASEKLKLLMRDTQQSFSVVCTNLVNASGLSALSLRKKMDFLDPLELSMGYAKGNYFSYSGRNLFKRLIYPVPEKHGLGIHLTLNLAGEILFGPDVEWTQLPDFIVNKDRKPDFLQAIKNYFPTVEKDRLQPAYCGVRPKLLKNNGDVHQDFFIEHSRLFGSQIINLLGIESPGLTSSLAIGKHVKYLLNK